MKISYEELRRLNPYLKNKSKEDSEKLMTTILECGYSWDENLKLFWHPKTQKEIKPIDLGKFTAESFKDTFENYWKTSKWQKEKELRQTYYKYLILSILLFLVSIISFLLKLKKEII